ncbi:MAG: ABC transporter substrate-binding protein [Candidatus Taylorbacteria bacterium]|nr:ABC transporter substrate-binding protein [Candidatus Taylorbacteria bacterium]
MNKNTKIFLGVILLVAVIIGVVYINQRSDSLSTRPFKIGVIAPLTGDFGAVGENIVKGIKTAQSVYEAKTVKKLSIIVENDGGEAAKGLGAFRKLADTDQVDGLINTFTTTMDAIYEPAKKLGYPVMMEAFQANNVADDYVFQMTLGNDNVWDRYAKYVSEASYDQSKVVIVHSIDAAQASFAKAFTAEYKKSVTNITASSDKNGLRTDAAKIAALKPTMIVFFLTPENGAILTKELLPLLNKSTQLVYDIQLYTGLSYYQAQLGGDLSKINGAINLMFEGDSNSPEYKEFINAFKKLYPNEEPGFLADHGYDTLIAYMKTYDKDNSKWISNLKLFDEKGASGEVKFDKNGIRIADLVVKKVVDGRLQNFTRLPI